MNGVEKIQDHEFSDIMGIPLDAGETIHGLWETFHQLQKQRGLMRILAVGGLILTGATLAVVFAIVKDSSLLIVPAIALGITVLSLWRAISLEQSLKATLTVLHPSNLQGSPRHVAEAVSFLSHRVNRYNDLVSQLNDSQTGISWREFRKLTDDQRLYIQSSFIKVRGKILGSLRVCRQQIEDLNSPVESWDKEIVSRDLELKFRFALNTMSSEYYLNIIKSLEALEQEIRQQITSLAANAKGS